MQPGDLVRPFIPPNHGSPRIRLYDIPWHVEDDSRETLLRFPQVISKMEVGETGVITEVRTNETGDEFSQVLLRGILGWARSALFVVVQSSPGE